MARTPKGPGNKGDPGAGNKHKQLSGNNEERLTSLLKRNFPDDEIYEIYGPGRISGSLVWEIWTWVANGEDPDDDGEYFTRFVEDTSNGASFIYGSFLELAVRLDQLHEAVLSGANAREWERVSSIVERASTQSTSDAATERLVKLVTVLTAAVAFIMAVGCFVWLATKNPDYGAVIAGIGLGAIVASACAYYFGKYLPLDLPSFLTGETKRNGSHAPPTKASAHDDASSGVAPTNAIGRSEPL